MTTFGVTPEGFVRKTLEDIIAEMEVDELSTIADDLDVSTVSLVGQMNGVVGRQVSIGWEQIEICYHGYDPEAAEGRLLEGLSKLTGTFRRGETPSEVALTCDLDLGTVLTPRVAYAAIEDSPDIRWTPSPTLYPDGYEAEADGPQSVTFISELTGPVEGLAGTINVIATSTTGWNSVVNPNDAELGIRVDNDATLRVRREAELATVGSATVRAVTANVSQAFGDKLTNLTVFENENDAVDSNGLPGHSLEVLIFDGEEASVNDEELAQVILDTKGGGIKTYGNTTAMATGLVNGVESDIEISFSRAEQLEIYLIVTLVKKSVGGYLGDDGVKKYIAEQGDAYFGPGEEIIAERIGAFALACKGVKDIASIKLGLAPSPTGTVNIPVTIREIGRFSTSRITIIAT